MLKTIISEKRKIDGGVQDSYLSHYETLRTYAFELHAAQMRTAALNQQQAEEGIMQQRERHRAEMEVLVAKKQTYLF